jgi:hypothetical protein
MRWVGLLSDEVAGSDGASIAELGSEKGPRTSVGTIRVTIKKLMSKAL